MPDQCVDRRAADMEALAAFRIDGVAVSEQDVRRYFEALVVGEVTTEEIRAQVLARDAA